MKQIIRDTARVLAAMNRYGISDEDMAQLIKLHNDNIDATLRDIESIAKIAKK